MVFGMGELMVGQGDPGRQPRTEVAPGTPPPSNLSILGGGAQLGHRENDAHTAVLVRASACPGTQPQEPKRGLPAPSLPPGLRHPGVQETQTA